MHTVLILTLEGNTGAIHLCHTKRVVGFYAKHALDSSALLLGMGLSTDTESAELGAGRIDSFLLEHLSQTDGV